MALNITGNSQQAAHRTDSHVVKTFIAVKEAVINNSVYDRELHHIEYCHCKCTITLLLRFPALLLSDVSDAKTA